MVYYVELDIVLVYKDVIFIDFLFLRCDNSVFLMYFCMKIDY